MKCSYFLILILSICVLIKSEKWNDSKVIHKNLDLRLIIHESINPKGIDRLLQKVEKSFESNNPRELQSYNGLIKADDIILVSRKLLMWFSLTSKKNGRVIRSGGGLLSGMWEIELDKNNVAKLKNEDPKSGYVKNLLLAGSQPGLKLFGADIFGGYSINNVVWGIEYALDVRSTDKTGKFIRDSDMGAYSPDEGVFIQTKGILGNSNTAEGIESETDTDPRVGVKGLTQYKLSYRVPANRMEFITEVEFIAKENQFGPISDAFLAMYLPGYPQLNMVYASNPELLTKYEKSDLSRVKINKWFRNSAVRRTYFYDIDFIKHIGEKYTFSTPPGNGRILCLGAPENSVGFFCGYPNNDYIPKDCYEEYLLELSDNQKLENQGKFHTLNYKLLSTPGKTLTLTKGESLTMIMRYKLINAVEPMPDAEDLPSANGNEVKSE